MVIEKKFGLGLLAYICSANTVQIISALAQLLYKFTKPII